MAQINRTSSIARLALVIPEQRADLELSQRELAWLSGVPRHMIRKLERGGRVDPALVIRLAGTLNVLELASPPKDEQPDRMVFELATRAQDAWLIEPAGGAA